MDALIICYSAHLAWQLPALLSRAGFNVDILTPSWLFKRSRFVRDCYHIHPGIKLLEHAIPLLQQDYTWVIIADDFFLREALEAEISDDVKLKLLPVTAREHFSHLCSKIGLSVALHQHSIPTPPFAIATNLAEATEAPEKLAYPILLKIDVSAGGLGTYECRSRQELRKLSRLFDDKPLLVQKKMIGQELDISAIYAHGQLIHFNYAIPIKTVRKFGPSSLRQYYASDQVDPQVEQTLSRLGQALGLHGFTNISCIEAQDHERYIFEVDVRPNVWVDYPKWLNDDPAPNSTMLTQVGSPTTQKNSSWLSHRS